MDSVPQNPLLTQLDSYIPSSRPQAFHSTPSSKAPDMFAGLSGLSIGGSKPEAVLSSGSYMGLVRSADLSAVGTSGGSRSNVNDVSLAGYLPLSTPPALVQQVGSRTVARDVVLTRAYTCACTGSTNRQACSTAYS